MAALRWFSAFLSFLGRFQFHTTSWWQKIWGILLATGNLQLIHHPPFCIRNYDTIRPEELLLLVMMWACSRSVARCPCFSQLCFICFPSFRYVPLVDFVYHKVFHINYYLYGWFFTLMLDPRNWVRNVCRTLSSYYGNVLVLWKCLNYGLVLIMEMPINWYRNHDFSFRCVCSSIICVSVMKNLKTWLDASNLPFNIDPLASEIFSKVFLEISPSIMHVMSTFLLCP